MNSDQEEIIIPVRIVARLNQIKDEASFLLEEATKIQITKLKQIQFRYHQRAEKPILSDYERAQSVCFIAKYDSLPEFDGVFITEDDGGYRFENLNFMRHILNEYRPIIQNQNDSIYFNHIHKFVREKLINDDPSLDLVLDVMDGDGNDVTGEFIKILDERIKSIRLILNKLEFKYIYNGILQHSDHEHTDRFWEEYYSGEINYIFLKHVTLLNPIKEMLYWHYRIINLHTFPKLGSL